MFRCANFRLVFAAGLTTWVAATAGLAFGYSSAAAFQIFLSVEWSAIFASCLNIGGLIGSLLSGYFLSRYGRRATMFGACFPGVIGWIWLRLSAAKVYERYSPTVTFILGRVLTGVSAGMIIPATAAYLIEIAPTNLHDIYGALTQIGIVSGIAIAYMFGLALSWEMVALLNSILLLITLLFILVLPESPKWLSKSDRPQHANAAYSWLHGSSQPPIDDEALKPLEEGQPSDAMVQPSFRYYIVPCAAIPSGQMARLRVTTILMALQQLTGINALLYFAESVCMFGGLSWPATCAVLMGISQLFFTLGGMYFIKRFSRKHMLLISSLVMCGAHLLHAVIIFFGHPYTALNVVGKLCIIIFLFGFSIGWGPLPILVTMDMFPVSTRGFASASGVAVNWILSFVVTVSFEPLTLILGGSTMFMIYSVFCFVGYLFVERYIPATVSPLSR
ncbi:Sugar transporter ERD6-like 4 [Clonorchis sinensis]|uniref:Transcriptional repressor NF-X1 n=2 Tax=Clonorchis sinensis TaxID=79923 RepID=H2KPK0_CLOSI|nr:Sugar transporter ERD6-like 4 [Clonorchis sinensis]GAA38599.2 transcriptional repressor NF-X1 [Clonorchis sinensis]